MKNLIDITINRGREYLCPHGLLPPLQPCFYCEIIKNVTHLTEAVKAQAIGFEERIKNLEKIIASKRLTNERL